MTQLGRLQKTEPIDCWLSGVEASHTTRFLPFPSPSGSKANDSPQGTGCLYEDNDVAGFSARLKP